ncbi:MAG: class A beta-lactamase-related serine hydrolase [Anaerolineaceae bacterium]|nr:class A beta-lactamase-related serine hydrolase [Anaerolineaceae bacterium]
MRWISILSLFLAVVLTVFQLVSYSRIRNSLPPGMVIADVAVGGLDQQQAAERLIQAYGVPIELHYLGSVIQVKPSLLGFELDLTSMLTAADLQRVNQPFWNAFWAFLWNRIPTPAEVPMSSKISEERLLSYLQNEISARYDKPPTAAVPVPGSVNFSSGESGATLDLERAMITITDALRSPTSRIVNLTFKETSPSRPSMQNLQILLQQVVDLSGFDGLTEIFLLDLQSGQDMSFAYQQGEQITPDIAFTAASTIKIPIMVSVYRRISEPAPDEISNLLELMIERSENDPADLLMEKVIDPTLGPLMVTEDIQSLGLESTFLGGHFYLQAPLLKRFETPANTRTDIYTDPDIYNQTTAPEIGMMLEDIYQCAATGGGALSAVFPGEITQSECDQMITYLTRNRIGVLIQAGMPDGNRLAHKHGWITEVDGVIHTMADVGIAFTPGGDYVICIFLYHPVQLVWEPANLLMAQLSNAIYNFYNQVGR